MQFQLPANLRTELLAYDPKLKALFKSETPATKPKRQSNYFGLPDDIIPAHIVTPNDLLAAITYINKQDVPNRYHTFSHTVYDKETDGPTTKIKAIVYHYESLWIAAWLPSAGEDYIYGFTYAYKNTATTLKRVHIRNIGPTTAVVKKYGRTEFNVHTQFVTTKDISNRIGSYYYWEHGEFRGYGSKGQLIRRDVICPFHEAIKDTISIYTDGNLWDRIDTSKNNYYELLSLRYMPIPCSSNLNIIPSFDMYTAIFKEPLAKGTGLETFSQPWFKRYINGQCQLLIDTFNNPATETRKEIIAIHKRIMHNLGWVLDILNIYPDCPVDYLQTAIQDDVFLINNRLYPINYTNDNSQAKGWLAINLPVESLFNMLNKFLDSISPGQRRFDNELKTHTITFFEFRDTLDMINAVLAAGKELTPPRRWRSTEFHNHVQAESWKITNTNEKLPQDLFPVPVKVKVNDETWTFIQPIDTHQLAQWGQAVRNCVGASSTYANLVKAKKQFIVLCMVDNKPVFTIQLKVSNGIMEVEQIAGPSNKSLTSMEREKYQGMFQEALLIREKDLVSN